MDDLQNAESPLIDTHLHLSWPSLAEQRQEVVQRARGAGVVALVDIGTDLASSRTACKNAETWPEVWFAAGVHPNDIGESTFKDLTEIRKLLDHPRCVAVGEIGLDYYRDHTVPEIQKEWLRRQLALAREVNKPVILHDRESSEDLLRVLEEEGYDGLNGPGGVFHCFAGDLEMAREVLRRGFHISFTGNITFKKSDRPTIVAEVPLDRLMLETDAPFMAPVPHRGKPNEPAYLPYIAAMVAQIKSVGLEEVARRTSETARDFFGIIWEG